MDKLEVFTSFTPGYYSLNSILLSLAHCFLLRVKNIERISQLPPGEHGKHIGLDRIPEIKTIRDKIDILAKNDQVKQWAGALSKKWLECSEQHMGVLYIDGREQVYSGKTNPLPRRYVSRLRLALRGTTDYWVNDRLGQPFFSINKTVKGSMIDVIKKDIIPELEKDIPNQPHKSELKKDPLLHKYMIVYDRECYSPDFMIDMWEERIACCTYKKYVKEKWNEDEFKEYEYESFNGKTETMKLAERAILIEGKESESLEKPQVRINLDGDEVKFSKKRTQKKRRLWIREIRKLTPSGHQTSIITTNFKLSIVLIGLYMFARWCQENFFKYMKQNFGIDFLIKYLSGTIPDTQMIRNPQWRMLEKQIINKRGKLKRREAKFGALTFDGSINEKEIRDFQEKKAKYCEDINIFRKELEELKNQKSNTERDIKFCELKEEDKFTEVYTEHKHFIDTIKIIAFRAEMSLVNTIKNHVSKPDEAHQLLVQIYKSDANIEVDKEKNILQISIHHQSTNWKDQALEKLCKDLNETETIFPDTNLKIVYKLI